MKWQPPVSTSDRQQALPSMRVVSRSLQHRGKQLYKFRGAPQAKREQQYLARAWDGQPIQPPGPPPPPPPPPPPALTPPDWANYSPGPPGTRGTISLRLESGDTLKVRIKEDGTYEQVPPTELMESPWPATQTGQVHLPLKPW